MNEIFVTGGAGFIGSRFVRLILDTDRCERIVNYDALTYAGRLENIEGLDERHEFIRGDIRDADGVFAAIPEGCEAIFNFAAESHVDRSIESAHDFVTTNVLGTQILLDCAREKNVKRFVHISTDEVMGSLPEDGNELFTESSPFAPNSPYAASKAAAEHFVMAARTTFGIDAVITRCGNNYGPAQHPEKLIPLTITNALSDQPVPVYGDGMNVRDWIYVTDHCEAIWRVFEEGDPGGVYNIGSRSAVRNIDIVKEILDITGKPHSLIKWVDDRLGHDRRYAIDPSKIENELGWKPQVDWHDGIRKTVDYYSRKFSTKV